MPKPNLTTLFDHQGARLIALSHTILVEICRSEAPRMFP